MSSLNSVTSKTITHNRYNNSFGLSPAIAGDTVVAWQGGTVGIGNLDDLDCAGVTKVPFIPDEATMGPCFFPLNFVTVCEAMPEVL